jgi:hypothetical protein
MRPGSASVPMPRSRMFFRRGPLDAAPSPSSRPTSAAVTGERDPRCRLPPPVPPPAAAEPTAPAASAAVATISFRVTRTAWRSFWSDLVSMFSGVCWDACCWTDATTCRWATIAPVADSISPVIALYDSPVLASSALIAFWRLVSACAAWALVRAPAPTVIEGAATGVARCCWAGAPPTPVNCPPIWMLTFCLAHCSMSRSASARSETSFE